MLKICNFTELLFDLFEGFYFKGCRISKVPYSGDETLKCDGFTSQAAVFELAATGLFSNSDSFHGTPNVMTMLFLSGAALLNTVLHET